MPPLPLAPSPLLPARMPVLQRRRWRKAWRYVAVFHPEVMICAADVRVGPGAQRFVGVWDRRERRLLGTTTMRSGGISVTPGRVHVATRELVLALRLDEADAAASGREVRLPDGDGWAWTRKRSLVPVDGLLLLPGGRTIALRGPLGMIDESAGYHAREVRWRWSTGIGTLADGRPVAWNAVTGINDPPTGSERALWLGGGVTEIGPTTFADDLSAVTFDDGSALRFSAEATRSHTDDKLVFRSDYQQPFGTFAGTLPGGLQLADGLGVMERHEVRW